MKIAKRIIAVGSCKGGVGKTTVTVNLAMALRRMGYNVGVFDADLFGPNVPLMLGIRTGQDKSPFTMLSKGADAVPFIPLYRVEQKRYIDPVTKFGLQVMSLGIWFGERTVAEDSSALAAQLVSRVLADTKWRDLDYLIIDLPPGTGDLVKTMLLTSSIDGIVLVNTPQEMTLLDTGRSVEMIRRIGGTILGRVENMSYLDCPECGRRIEVYSSGFDDWQVVKDLKLLGSIPLDRAYAKPIDEYHPFTQVDLSSPLATPVVEIATNIIDAYAE